MATHASCCKGPVRVYYKGNVIFGENSQGNGTRCTYSFWVT